MTKFQFHQTKWSNESKDTGVYGIKHGSSRRYYVGSSAKSLAKRIRYHRDCLNKGTHWNRHLQAAWNKYGHMAFVFAVLETCDPSKCIEREQFWMDKLRANTRNGFNLSPVAGSQLGFKHSDESKVKISKATTGRVHTEKTKQTLAKVANNQWKDPQQRELKITKMRGIKKSESVKKAMSVQRKGKNFRTLESEARRLASFRATLATPESRAKWSQVQSGKKRSEEAKRKMSEAAKRRYAEGGVGAFTGGKHTEETKRKMSLARKKYLGGL